MKIPDLKIISGIRIIDNGDFLGVFLKNFNIINIRSSRAEIIAISPCFHELMLDVKVRNLLDSLENQEDFGIFKTIY